MFISLDLEGATGIYSKEQVEPGGARYREGCEFLGGDLLAAVQGCLRAGVDDVVVADGHNRGANLSVADLPEQVRLRQGYPGPHGWLSGVGPGFDAAVFIAYHARAGTQGAILDHTYLSGLVYGVELEGVGEVGEFALAAGVCGAFGIPVVFVSGDSRLVREAQQTTPKIRAFAVKDGLMRTSGVLCAPARTGQEISSGVFAALTEKPWPMPLDWSGRSLRVLLTGTELCDAAAKCPGTIRDDARALTIPGGDFLDVFDRFLTCMALVKGATAAS